jgi:membrane-bound lytic murein transglycosylase B
MTRFSVVALTFGACLVAASSQAVELLGVPQFIDEMVAKHQMRRDELDAVFNRAQYKQAVIDAINRPATIKPWLEYRAAFVNARRVKGGLEFWRKHTRSLRKAERLYGVPQEIIVAVIGVETLYGRNAGNFRTLDALTTLAFDYPRRAPFFRAELENYLLLAREQQFNLLAIQGSYAGALGIPQFMPSSYRNYAVDFNGDGKIDLLHDEVDAVGSVANYLQAYGWVNKTAAGDRLPVAVRASVSDQRCIGEIVTPRTLGDWKAVGVEAQMQGHAPQDAVARLVDYTVADGKEFWLVFNNFEAITKYNNSDFYAMSVFQLAQELKAARRSWLARSSAVR